MQRFSFIVLPTLLFLVMILVGCQSDHEEKIADLEQEILSLKYAQAINNDLTDALFNKVLCDGLEHLHSEANYGGVSNFNAPLNASLVYSNSETGELYDLQPKYEGINPPYRAMFRHLVCDGVGGGIMESVSSEEQFDLDKHPISDLTLTNAILVEKLCIDNLFWEPVLDYVTETVDGGEAGIRYHIYEMCRTHLQYMNNYRQNPTAWRAIEYVKYNDLKERLRPPVQQPPVQPEEATQE